MAYDDARMSYTNTFIQVSTDCPVEMGIVPAGKKDSKTTHLIQFELLSQNPYKYTQGELIYEVHLKHKQISQSEIEACGEEIRKELFAKNHPCLRASMLPKKHGWGVHYNEEGKIAIYPMESEAYQQFVEAGNYRADGPKLLFAMRSSRG
ncbi:hypothetical protein SAMN04487897_104231 [Paenibacillus sp. yr247]|uniref:DUF6157 family protein n=1 Tax=Paenibacillus sp. yr247 TaxID=1761880 RepID=UPI0008845920|nr:DUF6157 family protein [Paenibacillus sp. yr247]SDN73229.1 hypothetical protein SAMN04487897_104231 [Paenibacillus sp. yr247]